MSLETFGAPLEQPGTITPEFDQLIHVLENIRRDMHRLEHDIAEQGEVPSLSIVTVYTTWHILLRCGDMICANYNNSWRREGWRRLAKLSSQRWGVWRRFFRYFIGVQVAYDSPSGREGAAREHRTFCPANIR